MYLHFTPRLLHWCYPRLLWHMPRSSKTIYLTFDDGPVPEVTPRVLEMLQAYGAKATFFCVGENVQKHPEVLAQVVKEGHRLGNHTQHHLMGSSTTAEAYWQDVAACQQALLPYMPADASLLFRPPYGRFTAQQRRQLQPHYQLVMWDVLAADYDNRLAAEDCLRKSIEYTKPGSIIVFHDSIKAWERLKFVLPRYLQHFYHQGYTFATL